MDSHEIELRCKQLNDLAHKDENDIEFWYARELMGYFGYSQWRRFEEAVERAKLSLNTTKTPVEAHFADVGKMVEIGSGVSRKVKDYIAAKQLATEMTNLNIETNDLQGESSITDEHVENNASVRGVLVGRGIYPEELPAEEDVKKLKRRVSRESKKLAAGDGFVGAESPDPSKCITREESMAELGITQKNLDATPEVEFEYEDNTVR